MSTSLLAQLVTHRGSTYCAGYCNNAAQHPGDSGGNQDHEDKYARGKSQDNVRYKAHNSFHLYGIRRKRDDGDSEWRKQGIVLAESDRKSAILRLPVMVNVEVGCGSTKRPSWRCPIWCDGSLCDKGDSTNIQPHAVQSSSSLLPDATMNNPYSYNLDQQFYDAGLLDSNTSNIDPPVSPMGHRNDATHSSSNLPNNDVPKSAAEESALTVLLRQIVQLGLDGNKEANDMKRMIQRYYEESRRREDKFMKLMEDLAQSIKRLQEQAKRHGVEPPLRSRPYRNEPYRPSRMPVPPRDPSSYNYFSLEENRWYVHVA
ncbi:hypothetical protein J3E72DRAFT_273727 [Bipolaris maydis]|nr:hypothetical protein J3E72DRAFT_273727 [Bipolaris maydis]